MKKYAEVAVPIPVNKTFHYTIPPRLAKRIQVGMRVLVPFGRRYETGVVLKLLDETPIKELKAVKEVLDPHPAYPEYLIKLARWLSRYYLCPIGITLSNLFPAAVKTLAPPQEEFLILREDADIETLRGIHQRTVIETLTRQGPTPLKLFKEMGVPSSSIKRLIEKGVLKIELREKFLAPKNISPQKSLPPLTENLQKILDILKKSLSRGGKPIYLMLTPRDKACLYPHIAAIALAQNYSLLILSPDLPNIKYIEPFIKDYFPHHTITFHSSQPPSHQREAWLKAFFYKPFIMLSSKMGLFVPCDKLIIIVDDEWDDAYKSLEAPLMHIRTVALKRAGLQHCPIILAGAAPSLDVQKKLTHKFLKAYSPTALPPAEIIDMREEISRGNTSPLSYRLQELLEYTLKDGGSAFLFVSRRGFSPFVQCRICGYVPYCPNCNISLTHHAAEEGLRCHHCNHTEPLPSRCPQCGSLQLTFTGAGTQRIEQQIRTLFPQANIARLDADIKRPPQQARIIIGTQLAMRHLSPYSFSLTCAVDPDTMMNLPDFSARTRTFHLLLELTFKVREGGLLLLQTHNPQDPLFYAFKERNFEEFFAREWEKCKLTSFPPATELLILRLRSRKERNLVQVCDTLRQILEELKDERVKTLGPAPAGIYKLRGMYTWQVFLKGDGNCTRKIIAQALKRLEKRAKGLSTIELTIDTEPISSLQ